MITLPRDLQESLAQYIRNVVKEETAKALGEGPVGEFLSTAEAASLAKVCQGTIRRWIRDGYLKPRRAGRQLRVLRGDLIELMRPGARRRGCVDHLLSPESIAARDFR